MATAHERMLAAHAAFERQPKKEAWRDKSDRYSGLLSELYVKHIEVEASVMVLEAAIFSKHGASRTTAIDMAYKELEGTLLPFVEGKTVAHQLAKYAKYEAEKSNRIGNDALARSL